MSNQPAIIILVEGGVVQAVVSTGEPVFYRLIDLDEHAEEEWLIRDGETDADHVDADAYTKEAIS